MNLRKLHFYCEELIQAEKIKKQIAWENTFLAEDCQFGEDYYLFKSLQELINEMEKLSLKEQRILMTAWGNNCSLLGEAIRCARTDVMRYLMRDKEGLADLRPTMVKASGGFFPQTVRYFTVDEMKRVLQVFSLKEQLTIIQHNQYAIIREAIDYNKLEMLQYLVDILPISERRAMMETKIETDYKNQAVSLDLIDFTTYKGKKEISQYLQSVWRRMEIKDWVWRFFGLGTFYAPRIFRSPEGLSEVLDRSSRTIRNNILY